MSEFVTKKEFETYKINLEKRKSVGAIMSGLFLWQASGLSFKPLVIMGTFTGTSSGIVTFTKPFKAGTLPTVIGISLDIICYVGLTSISNTAAQIRSINSSTQAVRSSTVYWVAIGESS